MLRRSRRTQTIAMGVLVVLAIGVAASLWWPWGGASNKTTFRPVIPPGWAKHVYGAVSFAIPPDWRLESYGHPCGGQPAKTVDQFTVNAEGLSSSPTAAVAMDITSCPGQNGAPLIASDETIFIQCELAPWVILGDGKEVSSGGHSLRTISSRSGYYFAGKGFVEEIRAGSGHVAQQILTTVDLTAGRC